MENYLDMKSDHLAISKVTCTKLVWIIVFCSGVIAHVTQIPLKYFSIKSPEIANKTWTQTITTLSKYTPGPKIDKIQNSKKILIPKWQNNNLLKLINSLACKFLLRFADRFFLSVSLFIFLAQFFSCFLIVNFLCEN